MSNLDEFKKELKGLLERYGAIIGASAEMGMVANISIYVGNDEIQFETSEVSHSHGKLDIAKERLNSFNKEILKTKTNRIAIGRV